MRILILWAASWLLASCASSPASEGGANPDGIHEISLTAEDLADLEVLGPVFEGRRLVQLGENTHGVREYSDVKLRLIRYLHEQKGFNVLAFESSVYQCHDANLTAGSAPPSSTLLRCVYGVWHTEEVLALFDYIRATHDTENPLHIAGFDVQPIGSNKQGRPDFLAGVVTPLDAEYAARVKGFDENFLSVYREGSRARRTFFRSEEGLALLDAYDQLGEYLKEKAPALRGAGVSSADIGVARQTARSMAWYIRQQTSADYRMYAENRDQGMAENVRFLVEEQYAGEKIILWAHNAHIRHGNDLIPPHEDVFPGVAARAMGSWLREWYQNDVYTVGFYAYEGQAADNSGEPYDIAPASAESLEGRLHRMNAPALFVDLATASVDYPWLASPVTARFHGVTPLLMVLAEQYDGLVFIDRASPRQPMKDMQ